MTSPPLKIHAAVLACAACLPISAFAQVPPCVPGAAPATSIAAEPGGNAPIEFHLATQSATYSRAFWVKDPQGRAIPNAEVAFVLPQSPASLVFLEQDGRPSPTPKRAVVTTDGNCNALLPRILAGPESGTFAAAASVSSSNMTSAVAVHVLSGLAPVVRLHGSIDVVAARASSVLPAVLLEWSDGVHFGPLSGVPVSFTMAQASVDARFANDATNITVVSDALGFAGAPVTFRGGPGSVEVRAAYPTGETAVRWRYVALDGPAIEVASASVEYGGAAAFVTASLRFPGFPCDLAPRAREFLNGTVRFIVDGVAMTGASAVYPQQCTGSEGLYAATISGRLDAVPFGVHSVRAEYTGHYVLPDALSAPASVTVLPAATLQSDTGAGVLKLGAADPGYPANRGVCRLSAAQPVALPAGNLPAGIASAAELPYGAFRFELGACDWQATFDGVRPPASPPAQRVLVEAPQDLPSGTVAWAFGPTAEDPASHWHELRTTVLGRFALFEVIDAGPGDDSLASDRVIRPTIALGAPRHSAIPGSFQDLWWAGPEENGWGMSLTQHRDAIFAALFVYDAAGAPRWLVMSGGQWNEARTQYTGPLYRPTGTPFTAYDAARFNVHAPVGSARLVFTSRDTLTLEYSVDGLSGSKSLRRQGFGPAHPVPLARFDDLWWGGPAQDGWGFALAQQYQTGFGVLFAYDSDGDTTWYVASSLAINGHSLQGKLYRTSGPAWPGAPYEPSRLVVTEVGRLSISLRDRWETATLAAEIAGSGTSSKETRRQPF
jgi:hypothetical protein